MPSCCDATGRQGTRNGQYLRIFRWCFGYGLTYVKQKVNARQYGKIMGCVYKVNYDALIF